MKSKVTLVLAVLSTISALSCPVMALEPQALPDTGSIVQPRWTYIQSVGADLDRYGNIQGYALINDNYRYTITVELRESNGSFVASWQEENADVVADYDLESGVRYYAKATVRVYNNSGKIIETATGKSSTITAR